MSGWLNFNGRLLASGTPVITAGSRALRYGDGLFETMRAVQGHVPLAALHFDRLFAGLELLELRPPFPLNAAFLAEQIEITIQKNEITGDARVRLSVFRGEGGLQEPDGPEAGFLIQVSPIARRQHLNEDGLVMTVFDKMMKSCDPFSNLKSNNYLVYVMAALHATTAQADDCFVLNVHGRVCDSTVANVFWTKAGSVFTTPLQEGGIAGVMRRHLLATLPAQGITLKEQPAAPDDLQSADEIFLTNAVTGMRWVRQWNKKLFGNEMSKALFQSTF